MRVAHVLRKHDPAEWGGTESALRRLLDGLGEQGVHSVMYCPRINGTTHGAEIENGCVVKRFKACVPVWGIPPEKKRRLTAVGGNLISFDLLPALWRERDVSLIHTHTLGRLGGIASVAARARGVPFVVSIHGGLFDLPQNVTNGFHAENRGGFDWGKIFGMLLRSRELLSRADAIFACNPTEAELLKKNHPDKRVHVQRHGIPLDKFQTDHRAAARGAFPQVQNRKMLLCAGRIDPVKNQSWLIDEMPKIAAEFPDALLVLAGGCTNEEYRKQIAETVRARQLENHVLLTGALPPDDPRLIGLFQESLAVLLPSVSETFGLVLLEAWATGNSVISSRTSGASALVKHGENGWLFDLENSRAFHEAADATLSNPSQRRQFADAGKKMVEADYTIAAIGRRMKTIYDDLIEDKNALRHSQRR
jgi:glycosyltransferase involved in cell wall biosynthesis